MWKKSLIPIRLKERRPSALSPYNPCVCLWGIHTFEKKTLWFKLKELFGAHWVPFYNQEVCEKESVCVWNFFSPSILCPECYWEIVLIQYNQKWLGSPGNSLVLSQLKLVLLELLLLFIFRLYTKKLYFLFNCDYCCSNLPAACAVL